MQAIITTTPRNHRGRHPPSPVLVSAPASPAPLTHRPLHRRLLLFLLFLLAHLPATVVLAGPLTAPLPDLVRLHAQIAARSPAPGSSGTDTGEPGPTPILFIGADGQLHTATAAAGDDDDSITTTARATPARSAATATLLRPHEADVSGGSFILSTGGGGSDDDGDAQETDTVGTGTGGTAAAQITPPPSSSSDGTSSGSDSGSDGDGDGDGGGNIITAPDGEEFVQTTYYTCITLGPQESHCGWHEPMLRVTATAGSGGAVPAVVVVAAEPGSGSPREGGGCWGVLAVPPAVLCFVLVAGSLLLG